MFAVFFYNQKQIRSAFWLDFYAKVSFLFWLQSLCTPQNVNCRDLEGRHSTPLHFAAGYNRVSVVEYLLHHGADVHAKDKGWGLRFSLIFHWYLFVVDIFIFRLNSLKMILFSSPSVVVWSLFTMPVHTDTTKWPSCWSDMELQSTWPICGSLRRSTKPPQRANMRSASCC